MGIEANGKTTSAMEMEHLVGQTEVSILANGQVIKEMALEHWIQLPACGVESGKKTGYGKGPLIFYFKKWANEVSNSAKELVVGEERMERCIKANGRMIKRLGKESLRIAEA